MSVEKTEHEDQALRDLVAALTAGGHQASTTAHPDRDDAHPLTVDAILTVNSTHWAVDHCLLSQDPGLIPATATTSTELQQDLEAIARSHDCALIVSVLPKRRTPEATEAAYFQQVLSLARDAAETGADQFADDGITTAQLAPNTPAGTVILAAAQTTTGTRLLMEQIREGIAEALEKKLTKQLKRAKDAGYPVMLLLDQQPRPGARNTTVWMVKGPDTVREAVQPLLDQHPGVVDLLWFRPLSGGPLHLLHGDLAAPHQPVTPAPPWGL